MELQCGFCSVVGRGDGEGIPEPRRSGPRKVGLPCVFQFRSEGKSPLDCLEFWSQDRMSFINVMSAFLRETRLYRGHCATHHI